jgi:hypothetical protein
LRDPLNVHGIVTLHGLDVADVDNTGHVGLGDRGGTSQQNRGSHGNRLQVWLALVQICWAGHCSTSLSCQTILQKKTILQGQQWGLHVQMNSCTFKTARMHANKR